MKLSAVILARVLGYVEVIDLNPRGIMDSWMTQPVCKVKSTNSCNGYVGGYVVLQNGTIVYDACAYPKSSPIFFENSPWTNIKYNVWY